jgi:hypothetical protein
VVAHCPHRHPGKRRPWSPPAVGSRRYERRRPERTPLYGLVADHLESWLASQQAQDEAVAGYVEHEFRAYLRCGILCHGFARARCSECRHAFLIAFSCKRRGVCPSCNGRRMAQTAAHLADRVIPPVPVRQWVVSIPKRLRGFLADRPQAVAALTKSSRPPVSPLMPTQRVLPAHVSAPCPSCTASAQRSTATCISTPV